jgi:hypothetical protein
MAKSVQTAATLSETRCIGCNRPIPPHTPYCPECRLLVASMANLKRKHTVFVRFLHQNRLKPMYVYPAEMMP